MLAINDNPSPLAQERSRRRTAEKRLDDNDIEFEAARRIQERLLPVAAPSLPGFDVRAFAQNEPQLDDITAVVIKVREGPRNAPDGSALSWKP